MITNILVILLTYPLYMLASPLEIGPIGLTGSGTLTNPDWASYGGEGFGGLGLMFHASGSNANGDTVSISTMDIELYPSNDSQDWALGPLVFDASPTQCLEGLLTIISLCNISIDGITGYGAFSNLGGGVGLIQVYAIVGNIGGFSGPGALLAEAEITNTIIHIDSVYYNPYNNREWTAQFSVVDPPPSSQTPIPEPGTKAWLILMLAYLFIKRIREK